MTKYKIRATKTGTVKHHTEVALSKNFLGLAYGLSDLFLFFSVISRIWHCIKSVRIRNYSGLYFPTFVLEILNLVNSIK